MLDGRVRDTLVQFDGSIGRVNASIADFIYSKIVPCENIKDTVKSDILDYLRNPDAASWSKCAKMIEKGLNPAMKSFISSASICEE
jgi:hypothetical protein